MLHARGHPRTNVGPVSLDLHYGFQGELPVVFNGLSLLFITGGNAERRIPVALAQGNYDIVYRILVISGLYDEHGSFEVLSKVGSIVAMIKLIVVFFEALRKRISDIFILYERKQVFSSGFDGLHFGKGGKVLADEEATVRHGVNLGLFGVLQEVVGVKVSRHSSSRHSSYHNCVPVVEVELLVEIAELLHYVVVSSKVKLLILVRNGVVPAASVLTSIAVHHVNLGPVVKDRVYLWKC